MDVDGYLHKGDFVILFNSALWDRNISLHEGQVGYLVVMVGYGPIFFRFLKIMLKK